MLLNTSDWWVNACSQTHCRMIMIWKPYGMHLSMMRLFSHVRRHSHCVMAAGAFCAFGAAFVHGLPGLHCVGIMSGLRTSITKHVPCNANRCLHKPNPKRWRKGWRSHRADRGWDRHVCTEIERQRERRGVWERVVNVSCFVLWWVCCVLFVFVLCVLCVVCTLIVCVNSREGERQRRNRKRRRWRGGETETERGRERRGQTRLSWVKLLSTCSQHRPLDWNSMRKKPAHGKQKKDAGGKKTKAEMPKKQISKFKY